MFELQALRRKVEGARSATASALGVRAQIYPHQVANVERVLSAPEIRHLIADEVGLGKTVQALMIINAVRLAHPTARVAVLVPDALMAQWRDELLTRAHESPQLEEGEAAGQERLVRLLWPKLLDRASDLDPSRYSLLVVDEIHNLSAELRDRIARTAADYRGVLLLSATPGLHDLSRRLELLSILEPHRVNEAARAVATAGEASLEVPVRRWPTGDQAALLSRLERRERVAASSAQEPAAFERDAERWSLSRRILRARREDFAGILPRRHHIALHVEPNDAEVARSELMLAYLTDERFPPDLDKWRIAQRVTLGGLSLQARLAELRRDGHDYDDLIARAQGTARDGFGDTRLDELCDLLNDLWLDDQEERVVVACIDNPTVDYVAKRVAQRLPFVGPSQDLRPLASGTARRGEGQAEDLRGEGSAAQAAVAALQSGSAQVLFAGDIASVGLNLQFARILIFYGLPWGPDEVEQWIGRLDRIGNEAAVDREGYGREVRVYTLTQRGLLDERVADALARFGVFERPLELEGDQQREARSAVAASVLGGEEELEGSGQAADMREPEVPLARFLPGGPERALELAQTARSDPPAEPALIHPALDEERGDLRRELALEGWLRLLNDCGEYKAGYRGDLRYSTFWYRFADAVGPPRVVTEVVLPRIKDPTAGRSPANSVAYISRRVQIRQPPRAVVDYPLPWAQEESVQLPLQFLSFGGLLHDDLVRSWLGTVEERPVTLYKLRVPPSHHLSTTPGPGRFSITVGWLEPGLHVLPSLPELKDEVDSEDVTESHAAWDLAADARWLRGLLPATTLCFAEDLGDPAGPVRLAADEAWALLKPRLYGHGTPAPLPQVMWAGSLVDAPPSIGAALSAHTARAASALERAALDSWAHGLAALPAALELRRTLVQDTARAYRADLEALLALASASAAVAEERASRFYRARAEARQRQLDEARRQTRRRLAWLEAASERAEHPPVALFQTLFLDVQVEQEDQ